jgi:hypothetical protein
VIEHCLRGSRRVAVHPSRNQHDEDSVATCHRPLDDFGIVGRPWNDRHAALERSEFQDALLPAYADDLVASIERVLHQVLPGLPRSADDAYPRRLLAHSSRLDARRRHRPTREDDEARASKGPARTHFAGGRVPTGES